VQTLEGFSTFAPLSALVFFNASTLPQWALYPLQTLNVFAVLYCLALGAVLSWLWKRDFRRFEGLRVLAFGAYGTGLLLWIAAATFFLLQVT